MVSEILDGLRCRREEAPWLRLDRERDGSTGASLELAVAMLIDQITTPTISQQTVTLGVELIERSTV